MGLSAGQPLGSGGCSGGAGIAGLRGLHTARPRGCHRGSVGRFSMPDRAHSCREPRCTCPVTFRDGGLRPVVPRPPLPTAAGTGGLLDCHVASMETCPLARLLAHGWMEPAVRTVAPICARQPLVRKIGHSDSGRLLATSPVGGWREWVAALPPRARFPALPHSSPVPGSSGPARSASRTPGPVCCAAG